MRRVLLLCTAFLMLAGCQSFGRGVAEAVINSGGEEAEDTRQCIVEGLPFEGVDPLLQAQSTNPPINLQDPDPDRPQLKLLYVHGIGTHQPGHAARLAVGLSAALGLDVRAPRDKVIQLVSREDPDQPLGQLRVARSTDTAMTRDMLLYELTWSAINTPAKESIAFDSSEIYSSRRASINQSIRAFVNDIAPDPIAYAGNKGKLIQEAVSQSICWALSRSWGDLPAVQEPQACDFDEQFGSRAAIDSLAIVTHSLGSRASIDALQRTVRLAQSPEYRDNPQVAAVRTDLSERTIPVFMLSNQLPLLEAGQEPREVTGEAARFCEAGAPGEGERFFKSTQIIAFNDPNDIMSYPVPEAWAEEYLDSRLCAAVTNVTINVVPVRSVLGFGEIADPLAAHSNYDADERVAALIAYGAGQDDAAPIVKERCQWIATDEALMN